MHAPIGIMSAMHQELHTALPLMTNPHVVTHAQRAFTQAAWHQHPVVAVLSKIGKVAAATTATALIEHFGVRSIVFTGVAGGLGHGVNVGDVVLARSLVQHDMDASPLFAPMEIPLYGKTEFACDTHLTDNLANVIASLLQQPQRLLSPAAMQQFQLHQPRLHQGLIASGDQFIHQLTQSAYIQQRLPQVLAAEMECAAVAQVCHDYGIPFAAIRVISDRADSTAAHDFTQFIADVASQYSAGILDAWLQQLSTTKPNQ